MKDRLDVYWCKAYQRNACKDKSPHFVQLKADEAPMPVVHECMLCLQKEGKREEHPEIECPKK